MSEAAAPAAPAAAPASGSTPATPASSTPAASGSTPAAPAAATKPAPAKVWELKANGKSLKLTEEQLIARASQAEGADQRFQEAAQMRKQAEAALGRLKDPAQFIEALQDPALGLTKEQIREAMEAWYAREFIEPEKLTPAEKKLREAEEKLKKYDKENQEREAKKLKDEQDAQTANARKEIQTQIIEALESSDLPRTNFTIRRLAYWMSRNRDMGFDAPTSVLVERVRNDYNTNLREMVQSSDGETLIKLLGNDIVTKLRKYDLEQLRKTRGGGAPTPPADPAAPVTPSGERVPTSADVNRKIRELQKTGRY
jgi:hypothetical protein